MHIVHVTHRAWPTIGGSERYVQEVARRQVLDGHQATVVTTNAQDLSALWDRRSRQIGADVPDEHEGVVIRRLPTQHLPVGGVSFPILRRVNWLLDRCSIPAARRLAQFSPWVPGLKQALVDEAGDVMFAWNITLEGLTAAVASEARRRSTPWVAVPILHLARPGFYTMRHQLSLLKEAQAVVALTATERDFLLAHGFAPDRVHVVSPGINLAEASTADGRRLRRKHGIDGPIVLTLAALCYDKGTSHLLAAAQQLWQEGRDVTVVLAGPLQSSARRALARVPAREQARVLYLGEVSEAEKWDALDAADVLALPSRTDSFGIVYLEAWSRGKPVIGARAGAVPDVIDDGADGLLVPFGDVGALARALQRLLDDAELRGRLGRRGREKVAQHYRWEQQYSRLRRIVDRVAAV